MSCPQVVVFCDTCLLAIAWFYISMSWFAWVWVFTHRGGVCLLSKVHNICYIFVEAGNTWICSSTNFLCLNTQVCLIHCSQWKVSFESFVIQTLLYYCMQGEIHHHPSTLAECQMVLDGQLQNLWPLKFLLNTDRKFIIFHWMTDIRTGIWFVLMCFCWMHLKHFLVWSDLMRLTDLMS